ncbi:MAG: HAMP domain-containing histidine kinase [Polaromonas sp.]|nr:HAMP domain-containing histidine kinase [Polaromonas sp.]
MNKLTTPPRMFAIISLLMIVAMVIGTGLIQAPFFRQSIIEREAVIVRDMVNALAMEHGIVASDLENYTDADARARLNQSFNALKMLSGTARIKVFNPDGAIIWSDDPGLLGTKDTAHPDRLTRAMGGEVQAVFNSASSDNINTPEQELPDPATIECYVPIFEGGTNANAAGVIGVLSLYRDPHDLNRTIQHGLYLLWTVIGGAGLVLFVALYQLFSLVYSRQRNAESKFSKLTVEHERIVQIEKMSAMGELVGEIAHQLNNPLVGVINLTQLAERQVQNPQRVAELLAEVRKAGTECRDIVQRILRINQISRSAPHPTDIKELVRDTITFCHQSIALHHAVDFVAPEQKIMLNVDPVLIRQALFNLVHNAILAAPDTQVHVKLAFAEHEGVPGVVLSVTDAGSGFTSETAALLFKPFFTTRSNGTGLGLPVAQHIVMKHGGAILAENLPAGGARFSIWLPSITTL